MARAEQALNTWPERTAPEFRATMEQVLADLLEIAALLPPETTHVEKSKTKAYIGIVLSTMWRVKGMETLEESLVYFQEAEDMLTGTEDPVYVASLDYSMADAQRQSTSLNLNRLTEAWTRFDRARQVFARENHPREELALEGITLVENMIPGTLVLNALNQGSPTVLKLLHIVEKEGQLSGESRSLLKPAFQESGGTANIAAGVLDQIYDLPEAMKNSPGYPAMRREIDNITISFLPPLDQLLFKKLFEIIEEEPEDLKDDPDRKRRLTEMANRIFKTLAANQGGLEAQRAIGSEIEDQLRTQAYSLHYAQAPPPNTRAAELYDMCYLFKLYLMEQRHLGNGDQSRQQMDLLRQTMTLGANIRRIGADDDRAMIFEKNELRPLAARIRAFSFRRNPMIVRSKWGSLPASIDSNLIYFAGPDSIKQQVDAISKKMGFEIADVQSGSDTVSQVRWKQMQRAMITIFYMDLDAAQRSPEGAASQAATAYELGIASTLGKPRIVLQPEGQNPLFDVDINAVAFTGNAHPDQRNIEKAIDLATSWTHPSHKSTGFRTTADFIQRFYPPQQDSLAEHHRSKISADEEDALVTLQHTRSFIGTLKDDPSQLIFPIWEAAYPAKYDKVLFHITRLTPSEWVQSAYAVAQQVCKRLDYTHMPCDEPTDSDIIRAIWNGLATSTHILADLTGFSANVAFELGVAHTLGKPTMIILQEDAADMSAIMKEHFPMLARERYYLYSKHEDLSSYISGFLQTEKRHHGAT